MSPAPLVVLMLAVILVSSCLASTPSTSASPFAEAHSIARSWWPKAEAAFISGDPKTLTDLYGATALDVATGEMQVATLTGGRPRYPRPFRDSTIFLPAVGADSNWFLAIIRYAPADQDGRAGPVEMSAPGMIFSDSDGKWKVVAVDVHRAVVGDSHRTRMPP